MALNLYQERQSFEIELKHSVSDLQIRVNDDGISGISVKNIQINRVSSAGIKIGNTLMTMAGILAAWVIFGKIKRREYSAQQMTVGICLGILVFLASMGLGVNGFITPDNNSDLPFHLGRIAGIRQGLQNGMFPVRLYSFYLNGYGYPNGIYYGDVLLYIPALLHMIGYSITLCYKIYVVLIHVLTAYIAYWSFQQITDRYEIGLLGSALYLLAPYRLACIYYRSGVGEYTAMAFFPLIICGLWLLYMGTKQKQKTGVTALIIGCTGIIQSHILSVVLIALTGIAFMALFFRKTFKKDVICGFGKALAGIAALNLWFIVPLADCMLTQHINIKNAGINRIQRAGRSWAELAAINVDYPLCSIGIVFLMIPILYGVVAAINHNCGYRYRYQKESLAITALSMGMLLLSSNYFPYDALCKNSAIVNLTVGKIQFPWRWIGVAGLCLTLLLCLILQNLRELRGNLYAAVLAGMAIMIGAQAMSLQSDLVNRYGRQYYYGGDSIDFEGYGHSLYYQVVGGEYLLEGTVLDELDRDDSILDEHKIVSSYTRTGNLFEIKIGGNARETALIELPLLNYKGYTVKDADSGRRLQTQPGTNNRMAIAIPGDYSGTLHVSYTGMWYWRISDLISLLCIAVALGRRGFCIYRMNMIK